MTCMYHFIFDHPRRPTPNRYHDVYECHRVKVKVTGAKSLMFPQGKTSIGNNSGFVQHGVMKFAYSMRFSTMMDPMVWLPSLSRDRKLLRVTKCTYSRVVGLGLKAILFIHNFTVVICISFVAWHYFCIVITIFLKKMFKTYLFN